MEHAYAYTDAQLWGLCAVLSASLGIRTIPAVNALGLHAFRSGRDVGDRLGWIGVASLFLALRCLAGAIRKPRDRLKTRASRASTAPLQLHSPTS